VDEVAQKRRIALALLLGIPIIAVTGTLSVLGLGAFARYLTVLQWLWAGAGLVGLMAWLLLSGLFLWRGQSGLRAAPWFVWSGLLLGALAAVAMVAVAVSLAFMSGDWTSLGLLALGPPLLLPAAHLAWLRWRQPLAAQG